MSDCDENHSFFHHSPSDEYNLLEPPLPRRSNLQKSQPSTSQNYSINSEEMAGNKKVFVDWFQPLLAEFFGQMMFAFLHCSTANTVTVSAGVLGNALLPAVSDGLTVAILVIIIGGISGAHVNFAVTTAVFLGGGIKIAMVPLYLVAQILGSLAGAGIASATSGGAFGQFALGPGVSIGSGLLMEVMLTLMLTLAVLIAAVELSSTHAAFAIGFAILIDILAGFNISGGCMNPTLSFGPAVVSGQWTNYWIYWVGPLLGAILAGIIFRVVLGNNNSRLIFKTRDASSPPSSPDDVKVEKGMPIEDTNGSRI